HPPPSSTLFPYTTLFRSHAHDHHDTGGNKLFGFWIYLMSDCILFATLFATYAVLVSANAGGPIGKDIFELPFVFTETMLLLLSRSEEHTSELQSRENLVC